MSKKLNMLQNILGKEKSDSQEIENYIDKIKNENDWLKEELNKKFSSEEHRTIAFMTGKVQLDLMSGRLKVKSLPREAAKIYAQSLKRKARSKELTLLQKVILLIAEEKEQQLKIGYVKKEDMPVIEKNKYLESVEIMVEPLITENPVRKESIKELKDFRISAIMDEFTYKSYKEECKIDQLSIFTWQEQLESFKPDLLFIESAWRGLNDEWDRKISTLSIELEGIINWCKEKSVPTVFWNKEDPIHFQTFINTAKKFDVVFTTDVDCIERYKNILRHDNIHWLPFAAQLKSNNPIEKYDRQDAFCFAGAYYVKYPERTRDLNNFVKAFSKVKPVIIYDRNFYKNDENYKFPAAFDFFIQGNLPFEEIDKAYKGYNYTINLNSIKQSQSMFARRVFEVLASNTTLLSNYSRGVSLMFGDLVTSSDNPQQILKELQPSLDSKTFSDYLKLLSLRKVLSEHTYTHRINHIINKSLNIDLTDEKSVSVFAIIDNQKDLHTIISNYERQTNINKKLYLLNTNGLINNSKKYQIIRSLVDFKELMSVKGDLDYVSYFSLEDYYGEYYLYDLILATSFSHNKIVGKSLHYTAIKDDFIDLNNNKNYAVDEKIGLRSALISVSMFIDLVEDISIKELDTISLNIDTVSTDYFNYCQNYYKYNFKNLPGPLHQSSNIDTGLQVNDFNRLITASSNYLSSESIRHISALTFFNYFSKPKGKEFTLDYTNNGIEISSSLENSKHDYFYVIEPIEIRNLSIEAGSKQKIYFDIEAGLNLQLVFKYLDSEKNNISHSMIIGMKNEELNIPENCCYISMGLRIYGAGETIINKILLGHQTIDPAFVLSNKEYLLVTNNYPSYDDLYRNGFVHSRVRSYKEKNIDVDIFRLRSNENVSYHEFEGIDVTTGSNNALEKMIENNNFKTIMVHFLDENIWTTLSKFIDTHRIVVWVHGSEIQAWHRRAFNYENESQAQKAKISYETRAKFWRELVKNIPENLHFVFVSKYFADEVMSDLDITIPESHYDIIANPIDTEKFSYQKKDVELRKKILSIRPYASRTYANDLTVKAILELSKEEFFEELEFKIIGDGVLFEETLEPLRKFENVIIEQRFLSQDEIAEIHKEYGIFLCPSRMDTQGVSRDEAMSSGLVPITNDVGAISEFLDGFEELMVPADDYLGLANKIKEFYYDPSSYKLLSKKISSSIENRRKEIVISQEINTFKDKNI